jgi:hypothetical protein
MNAEEYVFYKGIIDQICLAESVGDKVVKKTKVQGLCWLWTNTRNKDEWIISATGIVSIKLHNEGDPRVPIVANFVHGYITPQEAQIRLEQLERLRAFW